MGLPTPESWHPWVSCSRFPPCGAFLACITSPSERASRVSNDLGPPHLPLVNHTSETLLRNPPVFCSVAGKPR